ncbi:MAG: hypothetical protein IPQ01_14790 [Zoogloea sp.]|nr:hypothetical protein [Zoogloea sp.]
MNTPGPWALAAGVLAAMAGQTLGTGPWPGWLKRIPCLPDRPDRLLLMIALTGRLFFSVVAVGLLLATIAVASWIKIDYLGTPLTLADVRFFVSNLAENLVLFSAYPGLGLMLAGPSC